jgi:hypothetical protein
MMIVMMMTYEWLRLALRSSHQKYQEKNQEAFLCEANIYKMKSVNLHVCSPLQCRTVKH